MTTVNTPKAGNPAALELQDVSNYLAQPTLDSPSQNSSRDSLTDSQPPAHAVSALPRWNESRSNIFKTLSTFVGFLVMGANDAVYGAIIPYLQPYYGISYTVVSLVFLSPMVGYVSAAALNNTLHKTVGQRGVAIVGPGAHLLAYIIISVHPPYPALVCVFVLAGFGNGVLDAAWNAWLGNLANPNEILGFLHGFYGVGATIAPTIATTMITQRGWGWYTFYYIMIGGALVELLTATSAFWQESGARFRATISAEAASGATRAALKTRVAWVSAVFLLCYVGIEVSLGGWIVNFMIEIRKGQEFESGLVATGFWLGITMGRVILGFVTPRIGEHVSIVLYLLLASAMQITLWLVPSFAISSVAVALVGFLLGPLFPAVVVATTKLLPAHLHVATIGFAAAFGGSGACVLPFGVGAVAQATGLWSLQPIILAMLIFSCFLWAFGIPNIAKTGGEATAAERKVGKAKQEVKRMFYGCFAARL